MNPVVLFRKVAAVPFHSQLLLVEAMFWLTVARIALKAVPFPRIGRYLGTLESPSSEMPFASEDIQQRARTIGWAVNTAGAHLPVEMVCLPRALAGWQMLYRRGIASRLHFGAMRERHPKTGELQTHAWLTAPGARVTGYPVAHECVELGYFARSTQPHDER
ncbi:lasso peptide biosynthesis B2 protein [Terriglobus sp. RCC_193]|uniref:lasso peptide biosynthesis B2 protein n=1 Tax=Terriglobus sp. RCC_193 TaxID=3239218 RepID=UPI0035241060